MAIRRWRWYLGLPVGVILIPPLLWLAVVIIAPTGWAKGKVVAILESRSGRRVSLDKLSVPLFGGIRLTNLQIGSPQDLGNPWFKAADIRLNTSPLQLITGNLRPTRVDVDDADLRVFRRLDGTVELADLIQPIPDPTLPSIAKNSRPSHPIAIEVHHATLHVLDEPTRTRIDLHDVEGEGYCEERRIIVSRLRGKVNGGEVRFAAQLDRTASAMSLEAQLRADDVNLDEEMKILCYAVPVLAGAPSAVKGQLNADLSIQGQGPSWEALRSSLTGHGVLSLNPIELGRTPLVVELSKFADLSGKNRRAGSIRTDFVYRNRRIATDHFTMNLARIPMTLSGWTDLDGRVDYLVKIHGLNDRLPDRARRILGDLKVNVGALASITLRGTLDQMVVQVNGVPIDSNVLRDVQLNRDEKEKLRLLGRQLRDKILR